MRPILRRVMNTEHIDLSRWEAAQRQACEAERIASRGWLRLSTADVEFLRLRSRELRLRADCMLADLVAICRWHERDRAAPRRRRAA